MILSMISYMIQYYLPNATILDAPVTVQELCTHPLDTSSDLCCASDRIQLVCPMQLILWTFAGGAMHCTAEHCCRDLQPIHAEDVPESTSKTDQLVGPAVVSRVFATLVDLSDDWIHSLMKHIETTLFLPILVSVGAS